MSTISSQPRKALSGHAHPRSSNAATHDKQTITVLNVRFLLITLGLLVVLCPAAYFWNRYQVRRMSDELLARAAEFEQQKKWMSALKYADQYRRLHPHDPQAHIRMATIYDHVAKDARSKARAVALFDRALGLAPKEQHPELLKRHAELSLDMRRFRVAREQADRLLALNPDSVDGKRIRAIALYRQHLADGSVSETDAVAALEKARAVAPGDPTLAITLAGIYRQNRNDPEQANGVIEQMLDAAPRNSNALLAAAGYRAEYDLPGSDELVSRAVKVEPDNYTVRLAAAEGASRRWREARERDDDKQAQMHYDAAVAHYEHAIEIRPRTNLAYLALGRLQSENNERGRSLTTFEQGLRKVGGSDWDLKLALVQAQLADGKLDQAGGTLADLDALLAERRPRLSQRAALRATSQLGILRGRLLWSRQRPLEAMSVLERVVAAETAARMPGEDVTQHTNALELLGRVYASAGRWDQAAMTYEQATTLRPSETTYHLVAAEAWARAGQPASAINHYETAIRMAEEPPPPWVNQARRALIRSRLQIHGWLPADERSANIKMARDQLLAARKADDNSWELAMLEVDFVLLQSQQAGVEISDEQRGHIVKRLQTVERQAADQVGVWRALTRSYARMGLKEDADRTLERVRRLSQDDPRAYTVLHAQTLVQREQFQEAERALRQRLQSTPPDRQASLVLQLVNVLLQSQQTDEAREELARLCKLQPNNVRLLEQFFDLTLDTNADSAEARWAELEPWMQRLARADGGGRTYWKYYEARRLMDRSSSTRDASFAEASRLQTDIEARRPSWPKAFLLKAMLAGRDGRADAAIEAMKKVIRLGDQRIGNFQRLIELLYIQQRFVEADQYLARLQRTLPLSRGLTSLAISVAVGRQDWDEAVVRAKQRVDRFPDDPMARVWLGQTLLLSGQQEQAETTLREAVELAPADVRTWNGLFSFYVRTQRVEDARETLDELVENVDLPEAQQAFVLGQGCELLGDRDAARDHYRRAAELEPRSVTVHSRWAAFLLREDVGAAEQALRHVLRLAPDTPAVRRALAVVLATRPGDEGWQEAQQLLNQESAEGLDVRDQRLKAMLLARRPDPAERQQAREILEALVQGAGKASPIDRLLLARLYEAEGQLRAARSQYTTLVGTSEPDPDHVANFIGFLLRHERYVGDADVYLRQLEQREPGSFRSVALRASWLRESGRDAEIKKLIEPFAEQLLARDLDDETKAAVLLQVANLYSSLDLHGDAEPYFRQYVDQVPAAYGRLALCLAYQDRTRDAVRLCVEQLQTAENTAAGLIALSTVMVLAPESEEANRLAEPVLAEGVEDHGQDVRVLTAVATLRQMQQRYAEARRLYDRALTIDPNHLTTINNLASMLAERPESRSEARQLVQRALRLAPHNAGLHDTMGMVSFHDGDVDEAVDFLSRAVGKTDSDPRFRFHLALAHQKKGQTQEARREFQQAMKGDIDTQLLTPMERDLLKDLQTALGE